MESKFMQPRSKEDQEHMGRQENESLRAKTFSL
jgi:hypothetical protein